LSDTEEIQHNIRSLFRDLGITHADDKTKTSKKIESIFESVQSLDPKVFALVAFDLAILMGLSGDWQRSYETAQKLISQNDDRLSVKLWQLKCLVELERHSEAVALGGAVRWQNLQILHVNYLTALSYEALGLQEQAKVRFQAVYKSNPSYRSVAQKLINY